MIDTQVEQISVVKKKTRFTEHLSLLEASALFSYHRISPQHAELPIARRRASLTAMAIDYWGGIKDEREGDDLTRARLHQMVQIAGKNDRINGIEDYPRPDQDKLLEQVRNYGGLIDGTLTLGVYSELFERIDNKGGQNWYNALDLIQARQAVAPFPSAIDRVKGPFIDVLASQYERIGENRSVYDFGESVPDNTYAPGFTYAYRAEDRFLSKNHALATLALALITYAPDRINLPSYKVSHWYDGITDQKVTDDFDTNTRRLLLLEDWVSTVNVLAVMVKSPEIIVEKSMAA